MTINQINNAILAANDGLHSARALSKAHEILKHHDLRQPVLFHLVLTRGESDHYSEEARTKAIEVYQATIKALVRRLRDYGCRCEYFGAYEYQPLKGMHAHCFLLIETAKKPPFKKIMNINDGEYLHKLAERHKINRIHVAKPKNPMHDGELFARPVGAEKLTDCLKWASYEFKARSKQGVPSREKYFNSEFTANTAKRAAYKAALAAPAQRTDKETT